MTAVAAYDPWGTAVWVFWATQTKDCTLGGSDSRNILLHSSGGLKSKIKMSSAGLVPSESVLSFSPLLLVGCWPSLTFLGLFLHHPPLCLCLHMAFSLCPNSPFYKDTRHIISEPTLMTSFQPDCIRTSTYEFCGDTI